MAPAATVLMAAEAVAVAEAAAAAAEETESSFCLQEQDEKCLFKTSCNKACFKGKIGVANLVPANDCYRK
jgi:hypothetical protein